MEKISATVNCNSQSEIRRNFEKIITLLNSIVESFKEGQTQNSSVKKAGYKGQLRAKQLNKNEHTLELMTETGWKEAYIEVEISNVVHKGKLRFR